MRFKFPENAAGITYIFLSEKSVVRRGVFNLRGEKNICLSEGRHGYFHDTWLRYYRKLKLHEIKVLEINDFRIKKINAKGEVEFHNKGN